MQGICMCRFNSVTELLTDCRCTCHNVSPEFFIILFLNVFFNLILTSARSTGLTEVKGKKQDPPRFFFSLSFVTQDMSDDLLS
jgi:hypothetical protein